MSDPVPGGGKPRTMPDPWATEAGLTHTSGDNGPGTSAQSLVATLRADQCRRWQRGERIRVEDYLRQHAALQADPEGLLDLIYNEMVLHEQAEGMPSLEDYVRRFPQVAAQLRQQFEVHRALATSQLLSDSAGAAESVPPASATDAAATVHAQPHGQEERGAPRLAIQIRCPHCHNPMVVADDRPDEILCPGCGSSFRIREANLTGTTAGTRPLGKFQLLARVGIGAFGAVWRARDTELDRIVALKIPHASLLASSSDLLRFQREARAAAHLRHPGIITVHEVQTLEGLPCLVSDFIEGVTLRSFLESRRLTFRETATLIAEVAEALDYAHGMGLVHRDLKPANIMLDFGPARLEMSQAASGQPWYGTAGRAGRGTAPPSERLGRPLIMDFGLALRDQTEITMTLDGQIVGTPAYMSPEQAAGRGHQADRRSDVYSLGVILYELLAGELPFRGSREMIMHQTLTEEPRPPRKLNQKIPRDLETICLKAMAKLPQQRYDSAGEMAADLRCFLKGEPIKARPIATLARLLRWCARNPALAGTAALAAAALLGATGISIASAIHQIRTAEELRLENASARSARDSARDALDKADAARLRADAHFRKAREAVDDYLTRVSESKLLEVPGLQPLRRQLLQDALRYYQDFLREGAGDPALAAETARAQYRVASITNMLGAAAEALPAIEQAIVLWQKLRDDQPDNPVYLAGLAQATNGLGALESARGRYREAVAIYERARALYRQLAERQPDSLEALRGLGGTTNNIGLTQANLGGTAAAIAAYREAVAWFQKVIDHDPAADDIRALMGLTYRNLGWLEYQSDHADEALAAYERSRAALADLVARYPDRFDYQNGLAWTRANTGLQLTELGRRDEARRILDEARLLQEQLLQKNPGVLEYQRNLSWTYLHLGYLLKDAAPLTDALSWYQKALPLQRALAARDPENSYTQSTLARTYHNLAGQLKRLDRMDEALVSYREAETILRNLVKKNPEIPQYVSQLTRIVGDMGQLHKANSRPAEALRAFEESRRLLEDLTGRYPDKPEFQDLLAGTLDDLGDLHARAKRTDQAQSLFEQARQIETRVVERSPGVKEYDAALSAIEVHLADLYLRTGRSADALSLYEQARNRQQQLVATDAENLAYQSALAEAHDHQGQALEQLGRTEEALAAVRQAVQLQRRVLDKSSQTPSYRKLLSEHYENQARLALRLGRHAESTEASRARDELLKEAKKK